MRPAIHFIREARSRLAKIASVASLLRPYRGRVALTLLAMVVAICATLVPPLLAKYAIDSGILKGDERILYIVVAAFIASALVYWAATSMQTYLVGWVGQRALAQLRLRIFKHLLGLSIGFYSRQRTGVIVSRLTNDVEALDQLVSEGLVTLFSGTLTLMGATIILLLLDLDLALVTFVTFPLLAAASIAFRAVSARAYTLVRERIATVTAYLQETLTGAKVVKAFAREGHHAHHFAGLSDEYRQANMRTVNLNAAYYPGVELLSAAGTMAIMLYGGYQALQGEIEIGVVVAFIGYLQTFFEPIQQLSQLNVTYQQGMAALDKIFDLLNEKPDITELPSARHLPPVGGAIEFNDVWFAYDDERWALQGIGLKIEEGETVALVGHTGAGKSTLAKLVSRYYDPQRGSVQIDGHDLRQLTFDSVRSQLGVVPQEGFLFSGTVMENINFGRPTANAAEIKQVASSLGIDDLIEQLPQGYESNVGERGSKLSAGQRQLVAFARALIAGPRILLLDEATSSIDVWLEERIGQALDKLLTGRTAIVIAHRLSTVRRADRIVLLEKGRIVEAGSHEELMAAQGAYFKLYGSWA